MTTAVVIRRKSDGQYLTHWAGGIRRYSRRPAPIRSHGHAIMLLRIDLGEDLQDYEIVDADTIRVNEAAR